MDCTFLYFRNLAWQLMVTMAIASFASCSKKNEAESDDNDVMIVGPVVFDQNANDVGVVENPIPIISENPKQEVPDFIKDDENLRNKIKKELDEKRVDRYTAAAKFLVKDYSFLKEYSSSLLVATCEDFPYKSFKKAREQDIPYRTNCAGIEQFQDGNEIPFNTFNNTYYYNNPNLLYFSRWAYNLGNKVVNKETWAKLDKSYHGDKYFFKDYVPFIQDIAVITFQDWGYNASSIVNDLHQKNNLSLKYGTNRIYNPHKGVLIYETTLETTPESYKYLYNHLRDYNIPRKYYGFMVAVNNRISLSGHTEEDITVEDFKDDPIVKHDFTRFDKKVKFYKDFIKNLDFDKLYENSKADWQ